MQKLAEPKESNETYTAETLLLSLCVPDACSPSDFFGPLGVDGICHTKNEGKDLKAADIAFLYEQKIYIYT